MNEWGTPVAETIRHGWTCGTPGHLHENFDDAIRCFEQNFAALEKERRLVRLRDLFHLADAYMRDSEISAVTEMLENIVKQNGLE